MLLFRNIFTHFSWLVSLTTIVRCVSFSLVIFHSFVPFSVSFILENIYRNVFNEECTLNASTKCFEKMYLYLISLKAYRQLYTCLYSSSSTYQSVYSPCCHDIVIFNALPWLLILPVAGTARVCFFRSLAVIILTLRGC